MQVDGYSLDAQKEKLKRYARHIISLNIPLYASHACFFIVLAVFPALVLLMSILRYTGIDVENLTEILHGVLPTALMPAAQKLIMNTYNSSNTAVLSISAVTALWSAGRGIHGLRSGLNAIYGVTENRGYFYTRLVSMAYTLAFLVVLLLTLILHVFGTQLLELLKFHESPLISFLEGIVDLRFFLLLAVQTLLFSAMFAVLPNRKNKFSDVLPGALLSSIGWLVFSYLYSIYVENFAGLSSVYGSVYAVALSMLWLYFCVSIIFYGGALNRFLQKD